MKGFSTQRKIFYDDPLQTSSVVFQVFSAVELVSAFLLFNNFFFPPIGLCRRLPKYQDSNVFRHCSRSTFSSCLCHSKLLAACLQIVLSPQCTAQLATEAGLVQERISPDRGSYIHTKKRAAPRGKTNQCSIQLN